MLFVEQRSEQKSWVAGGAFPPGTGKAFPGGRSTADLRGSAPVLWGALGAQPQVLTPPAPFSKQMRVACLPHLAALVPVFCDGVQYSLLASFLFFFY